MSPYAEPVVVRGACPHDCPDTCALETTVQAGVAIKIAGAKDHPWTDGALCTKVSRYLERTYAPTRVLYPHRRVGAKGPGQGTWMRISWDEALETIASRFTAIAHSPDGPEAICPYSYAGTMGLLNFAGMDRRFFYHLGASLLDRTLCSSAGKVGVKLTLGGGVGMDPERVVDARLILIWGSNPITSNLHYWARVQEAKRRGARVVVIDPYRSLTAEKGSDHLPIVPGTDAALALAMMHVIITEGLHDADYVARHTIGFERLAARAAAYPPARAAGICGLPEDTIVALARDYATTRPSAIRVNYGLQRHYGGGAAVRAITCLPALVGAWRDAAGGVLLSTGDFFGFNHAALERPDLLAGRRPRTINTSSIGDALLAADPPIRALYVYNSNPVCVAPDSAEVVRGFLREDLFTVVHDVFFTDTADYADIFLPATTQLECLDVHKPYGQLYVMLNQPAIEPLGEAVPNTEVFRRLARAMGLTEPALFESDETMIRQALDTSHARMAGITFEGLRATGWQRLNVPESFAPFAEGGFPTPSGKCEFYSETAAAMGLDPLPTFTPPIESVGSAPDRARTYPLAIISPPQRHLLNSSFANLPLFLESEKEPHLDIHPDDAGPRGIADGAWVRIFNDRGAFGARARVSDKARPGCVVAVSLWWRKLTPDGTNANMVTSQRLADMGNAATFYDALVDVAPAPEPTRPTA
ncbi:MAG: molybdopterin-dependent oxidoreductase [Vicinamibacterales bacterium]